MSFFAKASKDYPLKLQRRRMNAKKLLRRMSLMGKLSASRRITRRPRPEGLSQMGLGPEGSQRRFSFAKLFSHLATEESFLRSSDVTSERSRTKALWRRRVHTGTAGLPVGLHIRTRVLVTI